MGFGNGAHLAAPAMRRASKHASTEICGWENTFCCWACTMLNEEDAEHIRAGSCSTELMKSLLGFVTRVIARTYPAVTEADREDMSAEALVRVYSSIHAFSGRSAFSTWVWGVAVNTAREVYRKQRMAQTAGALTDEEPAAGASSDPARTAENSDLAQQLLSRLTDRQREVVIMYFYEDLQVKEIAARLGQSPNSATQLLRKSLQKMKHLYDQECAVG